jgi:prephenate dehydrogenase
MGGSLAKALRRHESPPEVIGWALDGGDLDGALQDGAIARRAESPEEVAGNADLLVLAVPLRATCDLVASLAPHLAADAVVHDLASLKVPVMEAAAAAGVADRWVGGHPMAGSELSGWAGARADLYSEARIWLTGDTAPAHAFGAVERFWEGLGARPSPIDAGAHDERMALASHLPQLTANLLGSLLAEAGLAAGDLGPGGRDTTRLAASGPDMWLDILAFASPALTGALRDLARRSAELADQLEGGQEPRVRELMEGSRAWRRDA